MKILLLPTIKDHLETTTSNCLNTFKTWNRSTEHNFNKTSALSSTVPISRQAGCSEWLIARANLRNSAVKTRGRSSELLLLTWDCLWWIGSSSSSIINQHRSLRNIIKALPRSRGRRMAVVTYQRLMWYRKRRPTDTKTGLLSEKFRWRNSLSIKIREYLVWYLDDWMKS